MISRRGLPLWRSLQRGSGSRRQTSSTWGRQDLPNRAYSRTRAGPNWAPCLTSSPSWPASAVMSPTSARCSPP